MTRQINDAGRQLIKKFEALRFRAYPDPATGGKPWTIGYGHTAGVTNGDACSQTQADHWLDEDILSTASAVEKAIEVVLSDNQYAALVSFAFNVGIDNFRRSTLLRMINAEDFDGAADQFLRWNKAAGKVLAGLTKRREAERELFISGEAS